MKLGKLNRLLLDDLYIPPFPPPAFLSSTPLNGPGTLAATWSPHIPERTQASRKNNFRNNPVPFPWKQKLREHAGEGKDGEGRYGKGKAAGRGKRADGTEVRIPGRGESPRGKEKNRPACPGKDRGAEGC